MAVEWQSVAIPMVGGVDTKSDPSAISTEKLELLENGVFTKRASVRKRAGFTAVDAREVDGTEIEGLRALGTRSDELIAVSDEGLYSYDVLRARWNRTGNYAALPHTAQEVATTTAEQTQADVATVADVIVYAWQDSRGGIRCSVYNEDTGAPYAIEHVVQAANASQPRCIAVGSNILILYTDTSTNDIKAQTIISASVAESLVIAPTTVVSDVGSGRVFDAVGGVDSGYLVYQTDNTVITGVRACILDTSANAGTFIQVHSAAATCVAIDYQTDHDRVYIAAFVSEGGTDTIYASWYDPTYDQVDEHSIDNQPIADAIAVAGRTDGVPHVFWEDDDSTGNPAMNSVVMNGADVITIYQHTSLASSAFRDGDFVYVICQYISFTGLQDTYFLHRSDDTWCGKFLPGEAEGVVSEPKLARVSLRPDGDLNVALVYKRRLEVHNPSDSPIKQSAVYAHKGIKQVILKTAHTPSTVEMGGTAYLSGSQMWAYDGQSPTEVGFHIWPDITDSVFSQSGADADIQNGVTYNYRVCWEWTNAHGERQRSAGITRSFTTSAAQRIIITVPTLTFTQKRDAAGRGDIVLAVYRTEANSDTLYYRVSSTDPTATGANGYVVNDTTTPFLVFTDGMSDAALISNELDLPSRGEAPHFAPEGPEVLAVAQNRLFAAGGGNRPNNVQFSKLRFDGEPAEFTSSGFVTEAPEAGGRTVALGAINDTVIVFRERAIYGLDGAGPSNAISPDGGYSPQSISSEVGCVAPNSVVSYRDGVAFQGAKGIYLLGQDFKPQYLGAEVEAYNGQTFVGATCIPDTDQVVFLTASGTTLMYDFFYSQWSTFTNHTGLSARVWKGDTYVYLRSDGQTYFRDPDLFTDDGVAYRLKLRTGVLRLKDELQGFWRARKLSVLGVYKSSHRLQVGVFYNRDAAPFETFEWLPDDVLSLGVWGGGTVWGDAAPAVWGGSVGGVEYQFQHRFKRQKAQTMRLQFEDAPGTPAGASYEISEIMLEVGLRNGLGRIGATRKV